MPKRGDIESILIISAGPIVKSPRGGTLAGRRQGLIREAGQHALGILEGRGPALLRTQFFKDESGEFVLLARRKFGGFLEIPLQQLVHDPDYTARP